MIFQRLPRAAGDSTAGVMPDEESWTAGKVGDKPDGTETEPDDPEEAGMAGFDPDANATGTEPEGGAAGGAEATADGDPFSRAIGIAPELAAGTRPVSVSRLRRSISERMSRALW